MHRFSVTLPLGTPTVILRDTEMVHQITRVLRMTAGDEVVLFSGDGYDHIYAVTRCTRDSVTLDLVRTEASAADPAVPITLLQSLPNKHEKIDYLLQKGTEVGISRFVLFGAERSQGLRIDERRMERFRSIVREATEQSGRSRLPEIVFSPRFSEVYAVGRVLVCHGLGSLPLRDALSEDAPDGYTLVVGPEGGFSPSEMEGFVGRGYTSVSFGARVLRTETAGVVGAFFILQYSPV